MILSSHPAQAGARRGVILLIVISLLTLFAVVGIAFVYYANAKADAARIYRETMQQALAQGPDESPENLLSEFMRQFIFDVEDTKTDSVLRGHSLARTMYGYKAYTAPAPNPNVYAYSGTGRLHHTQVPPSFVKDGMGNLEDEYNLVNYVQFSSDTSVHHPERVGWTPQPNPGSPLFAGGFNASYTYPDVNNMFLGAYKSDGTLLFQSYHRAATGADLNPITSNFLYNTAFPGMKYKSLRYRSAEMGPSFPLPQLGTSTSASNTFYGDVNNVGLGFNDSVWVDIGYAAGTLPDGRKYKPLFAAFVTDLDNKLNINVHGNIRGSGNTHVSNQGIGPWEVNLGKVFSSSEWTNLFTGVGATHGRYGNQGTQPPPPPPPPAGQFYPTANSSYSMTQLFETLPPPTPALHFYGPIDFDGCNESTFAQSGLIQMPTTGYSLFPTYGSGYGNGVASEQTNHPAIFDVFQPGYYKSSPPAPAYVYYDRVFDGPSGNVPPPAQNPYVASTLAALTFGTAKDIQGTEVGTLCPTSLQQDLIPQTIPPKVPPPPPTYYRWLVTTLSYDVDQPGITPWLYTSSGDTFTMGTVNPAVATTWGPVGSTGGPVPFMTNPYDLINNAQAGLEFQPQDGRASERFNQMGKVDLNRPLTPYPDPVGGIIPTAGYTTAVQDRQKLAADILDRLAYVSTGSNLNTNLNTLAPGAAGYDALRWLAQIAVNIVDFIDTDDYMTPFNWDTVMAHQDPTKPVTWVFGTELPRLVINEVYASAANDPNDSALSMGGTAMNPYYYNFWAELHNPFNTGDSSYDPGGVPGAARLQIMQSGSPVAVYQVVVATAQTNVRSNDNVLGDPDPSTTKLVVSDYTAATVTGALPPPAPPVTMSPPDVTMVPPGNGSAGLIANDNGGNSSGYYLLGPADKAPNNAAINFPGTDPNRPTATLRVINTGSPPTQNSMTYVCPTAPSGTDLTKLPTHSVFLRRLACPYLAPSTTLGATYNPYVTVDYVESVPMQDDVTVDNTGPHMKPANYPANNVSFGRNQPYAAYKTQQAAQAPTTAFMAQPQNTFFQYNIPTYRAGKPAFDWLVHLDRPLVSPIELLNVSGFKPHELTQQFIADTTTPAGIQAFSHLAPWFDSNRRIYRALAFLDTANRLAGMTPNYPASGTDPVTGAALSYGTNSVGGRVPGKININTIWDESVFQALCDAQASGSSGPNSNSFDSSAVTTIFTSLATARPFWGLGAAYDNTTTQYPSMMSVENTILRSSAGGQPSSLMNSTRLLENTSAASDNPYIRFELLNKIYNNITTRSNVFAVWLTVGFFQVTDDTTTPYRLGGEIGVDQGLDFRHQMFAIVDRSALSYRKTALGPMPTIAATGYQTFSLAAPLPANVRLDPGSIISLDDGNASETLTVLGVSYPPAPATPLVTAYFTKKHTNSGSEKIWLNALGNPGPQPNFGLQDDTAVVKYYTIRK